MSCACRCHAYGPGTLVTCDVDTGSSGVPGKASCSPCDAGCAPSSPLHPAGAAGPVESAAQEGAVAAPERPVVAPEDACALDDPATAARRHVGLLCARHYHEIDGRLREIETLFALRDEAILPGPSSDTRGGTAFGSPAPGRIALMEITDARAASSMGQVDVPGVLGAWVARLFEERGWLPPAVAPLRVPRLAGPVCDWRCGHASCVLVRNPWRRPFAAVGAWQWRDGAWRLPAGVSWLAGKLRAERRWIAAQPDWVADYAAELREVHRALATATGAGMWAEPIGRCSNCQAKLFNPMSGADVVVCRKCKSSWSGVHYLRLRLIFEQESAEKSAEKNGRMAQ